MAYVFADMRPTGEVYVHHQDQGPTIVSPTLEGMADVLATSRRARKLCDPGRYLVLHMAAAPAGSSRNADDTYSMKSLLIPGQQVNGIVEAGQPTTDRFGTSFLSPAENDRLRSLLTPRLLPDFLVGAIDFSGRRPSWQEEAEARRTMPREKSFGRLAGLPYALGFGRAAEWVALKL